MMKQNYIRAAVAVLAGMALNFLGDWLLGGGISGTLTKWDLGIVVRF